MILHVAVSLPVSLQVARFLYWAVHRTSAKSQAARAAYSVGFTQLWHGRDKAVIVLHDFRQCFRCRNTTTYIEADWSMHLVPLQFVCSVTFRF